MLQSARAMQACRQSEPLAGIAVDDGLNDRDPAWCWSPSLIDAWQGSRPGRRAIRPAGNTRQADIRT
jgi:hypothetical protein